MVRQSTVSQWLLQWKFRKAFGSLNCLSPFALHCPNFYRHRQGRGGWWVQGPKWRYTYFKMPRIEDVDLKLVGLRFCGWYLSLRYSHEFCYNCLMFQATLVDRKNIFFQHGMALIGVKVMQRGSWVKEKYMEHQAWIWANYNDHFPPVGHLKLWLSKRESSPQKRYLNSGL